MRGSDFGLGRLALREQRETSRAIILYVYQELRLYRIICQIVSHWGAVCRTIRDAEEGGERSESADRKRFGSSNGTELLIECWRGRKADGFFAADLEAETLGFRWVDSHHIIKYDCQPREDIRT